MTLGSGATVGFVGTGVMGGPMAGHLLDAGYNLVVHNRTPERAAALLGRGADWSETAGGVARGADAVITMVGYPSDVEEVYLGEGGLLDNASAGAYLIDMSTSSPALAARIADSAAARGVHVLDAPVSGGDVGAREARLTIMVGGGRSDFEAVEPLLGILGPNVVLQGPPGSGQHTKMANQLAIAGCMLGVCEALAYARASGLDPETVLRSISAGSAGSWSLSNLAPRVIHGDFAPGFYVKHFIKDLRIALDSARDLGIELPGLELAERLYSLLAMDGGEELGTQALYVLYDADVRREVLSHRGGE